MLINQLEKIIKIRATNIFVYLSIIVYDSISQKKNFQNGFTSDNKIKTYILPGTLSKTLYSSIRFVDFIFLLSFICFGDLTIFQCDLHTDVKIKRIEEYHSKNHMTQLM